MTMSITGLGEKNICAVRRPERPEVTFRTEQVLKLYFTAIDERNKVQKDRNLLDSILTSGGFANTSSNAVAEEIHRLTSRVSLKYCSGGNSSGPAVRVVVDRVLLEKEGALDRERSRLVDLLLEEFQDKAPQAYQSLVEYYRTGLGGNEFKVTMQLLNDEVKRL